MDSTTAYNSPAARKRGVVRDFYTFSPFVLRQMKDDLALCMSVNDLLFCQRHFHNYERRHPTLDEIYFLDEIIKRRRPLASNIVIGNVKIADANIIRHTRIFCKKQSAENK